MYGTRRACFSAVRRDEDAADHGVALLRVSAGIRPGNAVFTNFAVPPMSWRAPSPCRRRSRDRAARRRELHRRERRVGRSTLKAGFAEWRLAPAVPATARAAAARASQGEQGDRLAHSSSSHRRKEEPTRQRSAGATSSRSSTIDARVDRVLDRRLAVEHVGAGALEQIASPRARTRPGSPGRTTPCAIAIGGNGDSRSGSQPSTVGMNPLRASSDEGRGRPAPSPSEYAITAPCEKPPSTICSGGNGSASSQSERSCVARVERVVVREADARDDVPVRAAGRQRERRARRVAVQALPRIERVEQREEVVLVGAAAVQEDESALRLADRRALAARSRLTCASSSPADPAAASAAARPASGDARSRAAGSASRRDAPVSSSVPKPGPSVAISKRTPLGSRK